MKSLSQVLESWRVFEVRRTAAKSGGVVPSCCQQPAIAEATEKASDSPCLVTVIHVQPVLSGLSADGTDAALESQELVVFIRQEPIRILYTSRMGCLASGDLLARGTDSSARGKELRVSVLSTGLAFLAG